MSKNIALNCPKRFEVLAGRGLGLLRPWSFWTVDPDAYKEALDRMLQGTEFAETDNYHMIARSAFGSLYAWGERYQRTITVSSLAGGVVALKIS